MALLLGAPQSFAQTIVRDDPVFSVISMSDGLSNGAVRALLQDRSGFLWIGTQDGLNRYDGYGFVPFHHRPGSATGLNNDFVEAIAEAGEGRLWVGTMEGGLNLFDPDKGTSEYFLMPDLSPAGVASGAESANSTTKRMVDGIIVLSSGNLLLSSDVGLIHFNPRALSWDIVTGFSRTPGARSPMCRLPDGRALAAVPANGADTIALSMHAKWVLAATDGVAIDSLIPLGAAARALECPGPSVDGYLATTDGWLYRFDLRDRMARPIARVLLPSGAPAQVTDMLAGLSGQLWIASMEGLFLLDGSGVHQVGAASIPERQVSSLAKDATGVLWIGTWNGLARLHPLSLELHGIPVARPGVAGISGTGVVAIEPAEGDQIWVGTLLGGLQLIRPVNESSAWEITRPRSLQPLSETRIMGLARGTDGALWIAALSDGIFRLPKVDGPLERIEILPAPTGGVQLAVYQVLIDRVGDIWATTNAHSLVRLGEDGAFHQFLGPQGDWDFGEDWAFPLVEDQAGNLWVGTLGGGVSRINATRDEHRRYSGRTHGLSSDRILTLFVDSRGIVWVGTEGGGLNRIDPKTDRVTIYTTADGLPHDNVQAITEDDTGELLISTNSGIARFNVERKEFRVYRESVGIFGNRFFANGVYKDQQGRIYFGGESGLTIIDPRLMTRTGLPPAGVLTSFTLNGDPRPLAVALAPGGLDLGPRENFFSFEFAVADYRDPTENRYRYQLEGLDEAWIESGANHVANYTAVSPASYTFRVSVRNSDGVWNDNAIVIPIRVRAPYYQTWWFRSLVLATMLTITWALYAYRVQELKRRQELRLGIAGGLHDDIGANLSAIALKAGMLEALATLEARQRSQLGDVSRLARESALKVRETVWVVNTKYDSLAGLVTKMGDTADMMLNGQVAVRFERANDLPERKISMELRQDIYLAFKEALQNVLKHAQATRVDIEVGYERSNLTVRISDNGRGFDGAETPTGNGMGLMEGRLKRHRGELTITSTPGGGSVVSLRVRA